MWNHTRINLARSLALIFCFFSQQHCEENMLWTDGFSIEATILLLYAMMEISPQDLLLLLGHTAQGLGPGKDTFLKLTQGPKRVSQALFLQCGLHTTKLGAAEPLESLVTISAAVSFPPSPSLSATVNLSITLHGGITKTLVSLRSTCRPQCPIHILKIPDYMRPASVSHLFEIYLCF